MAPLSIRRTAVAWEMRDPTDAEVFHLFGTEWLPLPLTEQATEATVRDHIAGLPAFRGRAVVSEGAGAHFAR
jgi:hypothetical protein